MTIYTLDYPVRYLIVGESSADEKWAAVTAEQHRIVTGSELQPTVVVDLDTLEHDPGCQWFIATADAREPYSEDVVRRVVAGKIGNDWRQSSRECEA